MTREMKDSGIKWIGKIPTTWNLQKIKNATSEIGSGTTPTSNVIGYYDGDIHWIQSGDIYGRKEITETSINVTKEAIKSFSALHIYQNDFIVIAMYGGSVGNIAISKISACANQACCCIKTSTDNNLQFLFYWFLFCKDDFLQQAIGGTQPNISQTKIRNQYLVHPPLPEQKKIAEFLDKKCGEIDFITADIQKQIETLEQYKRSVITEAVTKGLNPNAEMKDSGVRYIGTIPSHWDTKKGKYIFTYIQRQPRTDDGVITCFRDGEVTLRSKRREEGFTISEKEIGYQGINIGDLIVHGMDGFAGAIGISDSQGKASPVLNVLDTEQNKYYYMYLLRTMAFRGVFAALSTGIRVRTCDTNWGKLKEIFYNVPPISEQNKIADYLDKKCAEIESVIADKKAQIETIEKYKKSLIYEYVTGKKEVL